MTPLPAVLRAALLVAFLCSPSSSSSSSSAAAVVPAAADINGGYPATDGVCSDSSWTWYRGRCYWRSPFVAPWDIFGDLCRFASPEARPVSIHSEDEDDFVTQLAGADAWIGLQRYGSTNNWTWADGSRYDYSRWYLDDTGRYSDQCASIGAHSYYWNSRDCRDELYFICQSDEVPYTTTDRPQTTTWHPWDPTTRDPWYPTTRDPWDPTTRDPWYPTTRDPWNPTTRYPWDTTTRDPWYPTTRYPWDTTTEDPWKPTSEPTTWEPTTRNPWDPTTSYPDRSTWTTEKPTSYTEEITTNYPISTSEEPIWTTRFWNKKNIKKMTKANSGGDGIDAEGKKARDVKEHHTEQMKSNPKIENDVEEKKTTNAEEKLLG